MNVERMKIVERVVRPIVASHVTQLRMRLELYTQLELIYEEELAQSPTDPAAALARSSKRLGSPEQLRQELQQTVPRLESTMVALDRWFVRRRPGESLVGLALRIALRMSGVLGLYFLLAVGMTELIGNGARQILHLLLVVAVLFGVNAFLMTLLGQAAFSCFQTKGQGIGLKYPRRLWGLALLAGLSLGVSESVLWGTALGYFSWETQLIPLAGAFAAGTLLFALVAYLLAREEAKVQPWQSLELDSD